MRNANDEMHLKIIELVILFYELPSAQLKQVHYMFWYCQKVRHEIKIQLLYDVEHPTSRS